MLTALHAGGTILGKSMCESLCFSGGSFTSAKGPVSNAYNVAKSAGGSSSGGAVLVSQLTGHETKAHRFYQLKNCVS